MHLIAEEYLRTHSVGPGVLMILVAQGPGDGVGCAPVRGRHGDRRPGQEARISFVNHYSFHIMDSRWGHLTIKMAGHAPFAAQVIS